MLINQRKIVIQQYLEDTIGIKGVALRPYQAINTLPYLAQDYFQFLEMELAGHTVVLAITIDQKKSLRELRALLGKLKFDVPVILCFDVLASYERRYLMEQKIPFLVPGNQLYLPELGIDLREYFRHRNKNLLQTVNPATQAMFLWFLLNKPAQDEWHLSEAALALQYTSMSASRAATELVELDLFDEQQVGRNKYLRLKYAREEIWQKIKPYLKSPVKREVWSDEIKVHPSETRFAGFSALSKLTMINDDKESCYAISSSKWRELLRYGVRELVEREPGASHWQIWSYEPAIKIESSGNKNKYDLVDQFSLWLSFKDDPDDRVQIALKELEKSFKW
ncbi:hypothetical protein ICV01_01810 [Polynucleobacter sp. MWH-Spelu-300-X4]|uniref:hypothetical protein n=1 Tax=Polynucleobacter sp. MWH-Spelu-300-X4 TaxID=2689109 RepID=UPI001BFD6395|nr:hypothetical protein [Polynucleobacter sp. MWH-Spelu-300-X4]QWD80080.1 hypothetical protein ICV01_01810 [Polynucleobacter sp. MWH-Spelu-300-X4]